MIWHLRFRYEMWTCRRGRRGPKWYRRLWCAVVGHPAFTWERGGTPTCVRCGLEGRRMRGTYLFDDCSEHGGFATFRPQDCMSCDHVAGSVM